MPSSQSSIYFQKQGPFSNKCAVHTLNNLLGYQAFTSQNLNGFAQQLQSQNRHLNISYQHNLLGGDYDVSVLIKALDFNNLQCKWIDSRKKYDIQTQCFILNIQQKKNIFHNLMKLSGRHWICLKYYKHENLFYLIDSKQQNVQYIRSVNEYINFIRELNAQIIEVKVKKEWVDENRYQIIDNQNKQEGQIKSIKKEEEKKYQQNFMRKEDNQLNRQQLN